MTYTDHQVQADELQMLTTRNIGVSQAEISRSGDGENELQLSKGHTNQACLMDSINDSGYGSPPATPDTRVDEPDEPQIRFQEYPSSLRRRLFRPKTKIRPYQIRIPDRIRDRFRDLKLLFDKPLYDHLCKSGARQLPVVITLQYLGEDELSATPWIVVLCDKSVVKSIKQWFRLSSIRSYYCPDDSDLPSFRVLVHDQAPGLLGAEVFADEAVEFRARHRPLCGTLIQSCTEFRKSHFATLGGLIKVSWQDKFAIYGVTVDHVLHTTHDHLQEPDLSDSAYNVKFPNIEMEDSIGEPRGEFEGSDASDDDDYELDLSDSINHMSDKKGSVTLFHPRDGSFAYRIGITFPDRHQTRMKMLDWGLVDFDDVKLYRCNDTHFPAGEPLTFHMPTSLGCHTGLSKAVWVVSGVNGLRLAAVSNVPAHLHLGGPIEFVEAYSFSLRRELELEQGDCGSWIVDIHSGEVYGQIVASDVFGNVYALPLGDILEDIKCSLQCDSITFPTLDDLTWCLKTPRKIDPSEAGFFSGPYGQFDNRHASHLSDGLVIPGPTKKVCKRCHEHLLRCDRDNSNDQCTKCIKAGCPCVSIPVLPNPTSTNLGTHEDQHPKNFADSKSSLAQNLGSLQDYTWADLKPSKQGKARVTPPNLPILQNSAGASTPKPSYIVQSIEGYITATRLDKFLESNRAEFGDNWSRKTRDGVHRVTVKRELKSSEILDLQLESMR